MHTAMSESKSVSSLAPTRVSLSKVRRIERVMDAALLWEEGHRPSP